MAYRNSALADTFKDMKGDLFQNPEFKKAAEEAIKGETQRMTSIAEEMEVRKERNKMNVEQKMSSAEAAKKEGAKLFKIEMYKEAYNCFAKGMVLIHELVFEVKEKDGAFLIGVKRSIHETKLSLLLNMALCQLKRKDYFDVKEICEEAMLLADQAELARRPTQNSAKSKAVYRRGLAQKGLANYEEALEDLLFADQLRPHDSAIEKEIRNVRNIIKKSSQNERDMWAGAFKRAEEHYKKKKKGDNNEEIVDDPDYDPNSHPIYVEPNYKHSQNKSTKERAWEPPVQADYGLEEIDELGQWKPVKVSGKVEDDFVKPMDNLEFGLEEYDPEKKSWNKATSNKENNDLEVPPLDDGDIGLEEMDEDGNWEKMNRPIKGDIFEPEPFDPTEYEPIVADGIRELPVPIDEEANETSETAVSHELKVPEPMETPRKKPIILLADSRPLFPPDWTILQYRIKAGMPKPAQECIAVYIGAFNNDDPQYFEVFVHGMERLGVLKKNCIHWKTSEYDEDKRAIIATKADILLLSGGDPKEGWDKMIRCYGLDEIIKSRWEWGELLVIGVSAGAMVLGAHSWTDDPKNINSFEENRMFGSFPTLKIAPMIVSPHEEDNDWQRLKWAIELNARGGQGNIMGCGIPSGGALVYDGHENQLFVAEKYLFYIQRNINDGSTKYNTFKAPYEIQL